MDKLLIAIAVVIPFLGYILFSDSFNETDSSEIPEQVADADATTIEAMTTSTEAADPKSGITFTYPNLESLNYVYVAFPDWPPRFVNSVEPITCELDEQTQAISGATSSTATINGNTYCIWETAEGTAGNIYKTYELIYPQDDQYFTMSYTVQLSQCENYPATEVATCEAEQADFPLDETIDAIAQSAQLPR